MPASKQRNPGSPERPTSRLTSEVRVALVTGVALLAQAIIAKNVLDVELDFVSQYAALWVFIVYLVSGTRSRSAEIGTIVVVVAVVCAVLGLYAL